MMVKIRETIRIIVINLKYFVLTKIYGMNLHPTCRIAFGAKLDKSNPKGVFIGEESYVASGARLLTHGGGKSSNTYIGKRCLIGVEAIILQGVRIGDEVIVGAGSVVTKDVPSNSIVAGNPAKIIRTGISTKKYGRLK